MKKPIARILSVILVAVFMTALSAAPNKVSAAWSGGAAEQFGGGSGTEKDPFLIGDGGALALLAKTVNEGDNCAGKYFKLIEDIDLGEHPWTPIGTNEQKTGADVFKGVFDGNGHTVAGLTAECDGNYVGLFGIIAQAVVKNLTVKGTKLSGPKYVGGITGRAEAGCSILNCKSYVTLIKGNAAGGIVGRITQNPEEGAVNEVKGCFSYCNIENISSKHVFLGGIVGAAGGKTVISWCGNYGKVAAKEGATSGLCCVGGIIGVEGADSSPAYVRNCHNRGDIFALATIPGTCVGGIAGRAAHVADFVHMPDVRNSYTTGKVEIKYENPQNPPEKVWVGSIIGNVKNPAEIVNCYTNIPKAELVEVGYDETLCIGEGGVFSIDDAKMKGSDAVTNMKLEGAWSSSTGGYPEIDAVKAIALRDEISQEPKPEDTTPAETTPAETTPAETTPEETTPEETTPEDTTPAETAEGKTDKENRGGAARTVYIVLIIAVAVTAAVLIVCVVVGEKKKPKGD